METIEQGTGDERIESALNNAKLNAETELLGIEDTMTSCVEKLTKTDVNINDVIKELQSCINRKKEINDGLDTIKEINDYLNSETDVK